MNPNLKALYLLVLRGVKVVKQDRDNNYYRIELEINRHSHRWCGCILFPIKKANNAR